MVKVSSRLSHVQPSTGQDNVTSDIVRIEFLRGGYDASMPERILAGDSLAPRYALLYSATQAGVSFHTSLLIIGC